MLDTLIDFYIGALPLAGWLLVACAVVWYTERRDAAREIKRHPLPKTPRRPSDWKEQLQSLAALLAEHRRGAETAEAAHSRYTQYGRGVWQGMEQAVELLGGTVEWTEDGGCQVTLLGQKADDRRMK